VKLPVVLIIYVAVSPAPGVDYVKSNSGLNTLYPLGEEGGTPPAVIKSF